MSLIPPRPSLGTTREQWTSYPVLHGRQRHGIEVPSVRGRTAGCITGSHLVAPSPKSLYRLLGREENVYTDFFSGLDHYILPELYFMKPFLVNSLMITENSIARIPLEKLAHMCELP